jgi:hypothetical protein
MVVPSLPPPLNREKLFKGAFDGQRLVAMRNLEVKHDITGIIHLAEFSLDPLPENHR